MEAFIKTRWRGCVLPVEGWILAGLGGRERVIGKGQLGHVWRAKTDWSWRGCVHCLVSQLGTNLEGKRETEDTRLA